MTDIFLKDLNDHLHMGVAKKGHPFRYVVLGSMGISGEPSLRTVVLRHVSKDWILRFYTDVRSNKITEIKKNSSVSLLFYHPKQLLQVKVEGVAAIITDKKTLQKYWSGVQPNSRKDYSTTLSPASAISSPDAVEYLDTENHFTMVEITPTRIEYLKLKRPNHLRIQFSKLNGSWNGQFLVP